MEHGNQSPQAAPMTERDRLGGESGDQRDQERSIFNQLQLTRQWEADGNHLLRPAAYHAWAAAGGAAPQ